MKNRPIGETGPLGLETLPFVSSHMKDNVEVVSKRRSEQGTAFV